MYLEFYMYAVAYIKRKASEFYVFCSYLDLIHASNNILVQNFILRYMYIIFFIYTVRYIQRKVVAYVHICDFEPHKLQKQRIILFLVTFWKKSWKCAKFHDWLHFYVKYSITHIHTSVVYLIILLFLNIFFIYDLYLNENITFPWKPAVIKNYLNEISLSSLVVTSLFNIWYF